MKENELIPKLLARLEHAPTLRQVDDETFEISREDLRILLGARTDAAREIVALREENARLRREAISLERIAKLDIY